jgi:spore germination cell wall hydrolase CwlJ-like protein
MPRPRSLIGFLALLPLTMLGGCAHFPFGGMGTQLSDRECMTRAMYFESNRSSEDGMLAVGTTVMNRLAAPGYPKTVCGVVGQRGQYAQGVLTQPMNSRERQRVERVADAVLGGERHPQVGGAMFFHTAGLTFPYHNMHYVAVAGGNAFYEKVPTYRSNGYFASLPIVPSSMSYASRSRPTTLVEVLGFTSPRPAPRPRRVRFANAAGPFDLHP